MSDDNLNQLVKVASVDIVDHKTMQMAADSRSYLAARRKELDAQRKELTKPLDESKRLIMEKYRPALEMIDSALATIDAKLLAYKRGAEEIERKRLSDIKAQLEATPKSGNDLLDDARAKTIAVLDKKPVNIKADGVHIRTSKSYEVYDIDALYAYNKHLVQPNMQAIKEAYANTDSIPGVRIVINESLVSR